MATGGNALLRLQLTGQQRTIAGLKATSAAVGQLGTQVQATNMKLEEGRHRTFLMNQALFTLRRFAYAGTIALAGLTVAAYHLGFQFNITMENNTLAFTRFLGSAQAANKEIQFLFDLARLTPFEFAPLTNTVRQFLAFGFSLQQTNDTLRALADAVAGFGLGQDAIERATLALGQMRSTGRLLGQDVRQLMQLGLFNPEDFARRVGIAQSQVFNIGDLNIPSQVGIDAIVAYWKERFGGASADFAKTFQGQISTLHDDISRLFGAITLRTFDNLRKNVLPALDDLVNSLALAAQKGASFTTLVGMIDRAIGARGGLLTVFIIGRNVVISFGNVLNQVIIPALKMTAIVIAPIVLLLRYTSDALAIVTGHSNAFSYVLAYLLILFTYWKTAQMIAFLWNLRLALAIDIGTIAAGKNVTMIGRLTYVTILLSRWTAILALRSYRLLIRAVIVSTVWLARETAIMLFQLRVIRRSIIIWVAYGAMLLYVRTMTLLATLATWLFNIALDANPLVLIGQAVALLVIGLIALEMRFHFIARAVRWAWTEMQHLWEWLHKVYDASVGLYRSADKKTGGILHRIGSALGEGTILGMQHGGLVTAGGAFLVGEAGPEVAMLPRGSAVSPIPGEIGGLGLPPINLNLAGDAIMDGKKVGEIVWKVRQDRAARK